MLVSFEKFAVVVAAVVEKLEFVVVKISDFVVVVVAVVGQVLRLARSNSVVCYWLPLSWQEVGSIGSVGPWDLIDLNYRLECPPGQLERPDSAFGAIVLG